MPASTIVLLNLLDSDRYLIVAIDREFNVIFCNAKAQQEQNAIFGQSLLPGDNFLDSLAAFPEKQSQMRRLWQRALAGENFHHLQEFPILTEQQRHYEIDFMPLWDNNRLVGAGAIAQDVTARVRAEQQLRVSKTILQTAQRLAGLGHWILEVQTQTLVWSEQVYAIFGRDRALGEPTYPELLNLIYPGDRELFSQSLNRAISTQGNYAITLRIVQPDGTLRYLNARGEAMTDNRGEVARVVGSVLDVTENQQREGHLQAVVNEKAVQLEQETYERSIAQSSLAEQNQILQAIARDEDLSKILDAILLTLESRLDDAICAIGLLNADKTALICNAAPSFPPKLKNLMTDGFPIGPKAGSCGTAAYRGEPVIVCDIQTDPLWDEYRHKFKPYHLRSCWSIPVFDSQGDLLGTFAVYYHTCRCPRPRDWQAIEQFSALASIAIEAKRNQKALQESEARFRRALMNAPFPILIHAEDGEMILVNQAVSQLTGYTAAEIPTVEAWLTRAYGDRQESVRPYIERLYRLPETINEGEFELQTRAGKKVIWDFSSAPLGQLADGRRAVISMAKDVSARKALEMQLRQREARLRRLFESEMMGIGEWETSGQITDANNALLRLLGYSRSELAAGAIDWKQLTPSEYQHLDRVALLEIEQRGVSTPYEKEFITRDGKRIPVLVGSSALEHSDRGFFFTIDISDRKALEQSLQTSVQRLENLRDLDRAILSLQPLDAIALEACNRLEAILSPIKVNAVLFDEKQQTARWLCGTKDRTVTPDRLPRLRSLLNRVSQPSISYFKSDRRRFPCILPPDPSCQEFLCLPLCTRDRCFGLLFIWQTAIARITPEQLETAREVSNQLSVACQQERLYQDLHHYTSELEERVAQRTTQLQEINRELEAFTYSVSHDLRAPLRAIQGFSMALVEDYGTVLDELGKSYLDRLNTAAQSLDRLIQDLLSYSRLSRTELHFKPVNLEQALDSTLENFRAEIEAKQATIIVERPLPLIYSNATIIRQILSNLIGNALKFIPADTQPQVRIWGETRGNSLRLWIEDNGIGIEPQHQDRIFTLFERLHGSETYDGTGIGLALVSKGIERLGGRVGVESQPDRGSRFWLEFPQMVKS
jgi:PAS domain S-box-containing protein